jgi:hypothetical protein
MDLTIPTGQENHSKKVVGMVKRPKKLYTQAKKLLEQAQKQYEKHVNKTHKHLKFEVGQHMWLNIKDF